MIENNNVVRSSRIIKKHPGIYVSRVKQILEILEKDNRIDTFDEFSSDKKEKISYENRLLATNEVMTYINEIQIKDKSKMRKLNTYLKNFISKLNLEDISGLYKILDFYKNIYAEYDLAQLDLVDMLDLGLEVESLYDILYTFLSKAVLLPEAANIKQEIFDKEMNGILYRLEQSLENITMDKGFIIDPINPASILSGMHDENQYTVYGNMDLNSKLINTFGYNFSLMSLDAEEEFLDENIIDDCAFEFGFYKVGDFGVSRDELLLMLGQLGFNNEIEPGIYYIDSTQKVNVLLQVSKKQIQKTADGILKEKFIATFYTEDISNQKGDEFLESSLYALSKNVDFLINELYKFKGIFPNVQDRIIIDYETITGEKETINDDEGGTALESNNKKTKTAPNKKEKKNKYNINEKLTLDSLILNENNMEEIEELADFFKHSSYFIEKGVDFPKGTVFYGPPGNGKTLTAKVLSNLIDGEFTLIEHSKIENKWVGESEKNIAKEFDDASARYKKTGKKQILVIDEGDSILEARGDQKNHKEGIVSTVLGKMDGFDEKSMESIFVIVLTNRLESIDSAILRRFDKKIKFDIPNVDNIKKHLKLHISDEEIKSKEQVFDKNIDYDLLSKAIKGKSGSFINTLIKNSKRKYFRLKIKDDSIKFIDTNFIVKMIESTEGIIKKDKVMGFETN